MSDGIRCMWMRGGTSKGGYFIADDIPKNRDAFLLQVMGSPDSRQIDGMGGADPLTSKVAIVKKSDRPGVDVDYLFLQVDVERALVSDGQNCGNILAGVGPFAIERGLVEPVGSVSRVSIFMENTGQIAIASVSIENGKPVYSGESQIDGVPGTAAGVPIEFKDTAGSSCGALLPTSNVVDKIDDISVTMIDNGMPVVILKASDVGISGLETRTELDANEPLKAKLEAIRLQCGHLMNLGDVREKTVPKMTLISTPESNNGAISTRTFIPHRCHASIGVLGAVSVATAALIPGTPIAEMAVVPQGPYKSVVVEHPSGATTIIVNTALDGAVESTAVLRTARKLFDGLIY